MTKLETAKQIIKENYENGDCGLFNCRNMVCDPTQTIYNKNELTIDLCYYYSYFEVFGLSDKEFEELQTYYGEIGNGD